MIEGIKRYFENRRWGRRSRSDLRAFEDWCKDGSAAPKVQLAVSDLERQGRSDPKFSIEAAVSKKISDFVRNATKGNAHSVQEISDQHRVLTDFNKDFGLAFSKIGKAGFSISLDILSDKIDVCNAPIERLTLHSRVGVNLERCWIHHLGIQPDAAAEIRLKDCWIGTLSLTTATPAKIEFVRGVVQDISFGRATAQRLSHVVFNRTRFETSLKNSDKFSGYQSYQGLRSYLEEKEDPLSAAYLRIFELRAQRSRDKLVTRLFSYLYDFGARYGEDATRPVWFFLGIWLLTGLAVYLLDGGVTPLQLSQYDGWHHAFVGNDNWARIARSWWLPFQATFNPIGIFGTRQPVIAQYGGTQILVSVAGIFNLGFLLMAIMAIRKRFKLHG